MIDEKKLNKFLSLDWETIEKTLKEINQGIKDLEKIKSDIEALSQVLGLFYEEKYGVSPHNLLFFDLEKNIED